VSDRAAGRARGILMLVENLPVPFDRRVWMQATTLAAADYPVAVICPRDDDAAAYEYREGVHIYRYPLRSRAGLLGHVLEYGMALPCTLALACVVYARHGFAVVHGANPPDLFFLIALFFRPLGVRFVFDHHDLMPEICLARWHGWRQRVLYRLSRLAEAATYRCADRVVATNASYRGMALARGGVPPARVVVVRSAPRRDAFRAVASDPERRRGATHLVAYLGVMGPNDGLDILLRAIAHVVQERGRSDVRFVLVGDGDLRADLVALSAALRVEAHVFFTGRVPDAELIAIVSSADMCVAPDPDDPLNRVSSMNKIVEYMALGKPIVAFDLPETRATAGPAALYAACSTPAALGDRVLELLDDPARRAVMASAARARFETVLAWEHQAPVLLTLYRELLDR